MRVSPAFILLSWRILRPVESQWPRLPSESSTAAKDENTGQIQDFALIKQLLQEELEDISKRRTAAAPSDPASQEALSEMLKRYESAYRVALRWIKNYTEYDFRSLGSYTYAELAEIAEAEDAF